MPSHVDAVGVVDKAVGVGRGQHLGTELVEFFNAVERHVARTRDQRGLARNVLAGRAEHVLHEVHRAVAGRLGADQRPAERQALAGEDAGEAVLQSFVLTEQKRDFAAADPDVAGGHVDVFADVAVQLDHHRLAEAHHFAFGFAFGVEVRTAFGATHRQGGERVLEGLFEAEKFEDREIDAGVEAQAALVGSDRIVELHPPGAVGTDIALVVFPADAEYHHPVGFGHAF